ncbi:putative zinc metalloprotease [Sporormia fimetaria CBS 119925]|uniref:Peptide hydrolase n=1 Tax=Sporormia fimetaria CBS 119925 TaxID=1340428 RepID=A0A6A6VB22_9PLEO|nr:putative zinc metalloprotease [Sporormia fimetaria CBS 119925]
MARWKSPFAFTPGPVIVLTTVTYIALFAALLSVHLTVPKHPSATPLGTNLTQAWSDLEHITRRFHPYNAPDNDRVRKYLLSRIHDIVSARNLANDRVQIIDDNVSNATFSSRNTTVYFEGTNIMVAIRGSADKEPFYDTEQPRSRHNGGVLVNAHYDSVSTGYGATDDGMGVVSVLQLLSYFTEPENWPRRTVLLLLNNGEEDFLNGAKAFMRHPISQVVHTFLNLEGAGAGGRAAMFRSTDEEVTRAYRQSRHPFGTVVSADGFKRGLVASQTDYVVFNGELGLRGLDLAFMEPRARYHTIEDSTRETSLDSVWHMLSAAITTTSGLASDTSDAFSGSGEPRSDGKVDAGTGSGAVWFDIFGRAFVLFRLHTLFALNVTLLVVSPLVLIGLTVALSQADKNYLFARKKYIHSSDDDKPVYLNGWRGFFRFPIAFVVATAGVVALAYLTVKVNPHIVHSSPYAVWGMMLSAWFFALWFILRGASAMRPSVLQRMYALIWLLCGSYALLVFATIMAKDFDVAGGYFVMFYFAAVFSALCLSYIELFFAPSKSAYVARFDNEHPSRHDSEVASRPMTGSTTGARSDDRAPDEEATETTSLLGNRRTFARYGSRHSYSGSLEREGHASVDLGTPYHEEQEWSGRMPSSIWFLQLLLIAPINVVLVGQIALLLTSALYQTPQDGGSSLFIYIAFAALTTLILAPAGPFIHRFTYHIPIALLLVCAGTLIYNLIAFPFSSDHRLKVYFIQQVDLDTGANAVSLTGLNEYVQKVIQDIPSARGQDINCTTPEVASRAKLIKCSWTGLPARVVPAASTNQSYFDTWLDYSVAPSSTHNATISLRGENTRACRITFESPVRHLAVEGGALDPRFNATGEKGSSEIRLWHREWSQPWNVSVSWDDAEKGVKRGKVGCLWSDANDGAIPAWDEVVHYLPVWAVASKYSDGLVEGWRGWEIDV